MKKEEDEERNFTFLRSILVPCVSVYSLQIWIFQFPAIHRYNKERERDKHNTFNKFSECFGRISVCYLGLVVIGI